jgi:hypothetical protein
LLKVAKNQIKSDHIQFWMYKLNRFLCHLSLHTEWYQGWVFFQLCNWFQLFWCEQKIQTKSCRIWSEHLKKWPFWKRGRWLQLFSMIFSYFIFQQESSLWYIDWQLILLGTASEV